MLSFKDIEAYQKCMEVIEGGDWDEEVVKVMRQENYVIDASDRRAGRIYRCDENPFKEANWHPLFASARRNGWQSDSWSVVKSIPDSNRAGQTNKEQQQPL